MVGSPYRFFLGDSIAFEGITLKAFQKLQYVARQELGCPRPQTGARIPIFCQRGFRGPKTPISPRPCKGWKREFSVQKSPFSMCSLVRNKGDFFLRKLPFPERGEMGVFGPRNPLSQKMGIRAPVWGQGTPKARIVILGAPPTAPKSLENFKVAQIQPV